MLYDWTEVQAEAEGELVLMGNTDHEKFQHLVHRFEPEDRLLRTWPLTGGISAQVTALEIQRLDGQRVKMIVRRHGPADLKRNPQVAADEFRLLNILHSAGLAVPTPYQLDQSGEIFPTPYLVVAYVEGQTEFAPPDLADFIRQMAAQLTSIHALDGAQASLSFLPRAEQVYAAKLSTRPARLDDSLGEGRIRAVLEPVWPPAQRNPSVLLHGDYWPGNLLWRDGRLVAILDWEDAQVGDPLADLAVTRLEMLWAFGAEPMQRFTEAYFSLTPVDVSHLPYWDLCAALRPAFKIAEWAGNPERERMMRERHHWFVAQAMQSSL